MSIDKPSQEVSAASSPKEVGQAAALPKADFGQVIGTFEKVRGTRDHYEMVKDIREVVDEWGSDFSTSLRDESYPGWDKQDFQHLLKELGEEERARHPELAFKSPLEEQDPTEKARQEARRESENRETAERKNKQETIDLQTTLLRLNSELRSAVGVADRPSVSLEAHLQEAEADHERKSAQLKGLGWFGRLRQSELTNDLRKDLEMSSNRISELKTRIASSPVEVRSAESEAKRQAAEGNKARLMEDIRKATARLEELK